LPLARFALATGVLGVWIAAYLRTVLDAHFKAPEEITTVAICAATYLFGSGLMKSRSRNNESDDDDDQ